MKSIRVMRMLPFVYRVAVLLAIAALYAAFDVFNKRNVPNAFVYITVIIGAIITLSYPLHIAEISLLIALAIAGIGYVVYKTGFLGAGDVFEFIAISMVMPIQPAPLFASTQQFGLPFILSVFIVTGYVSALLVVLYYLVFTKRSPLEKGIGIKRGKIIASLALIVAYSMLLLLIKTVAGATLVSVGIVLLILVPSVVIMLYEKKINARMARMVYPRELEEGDMIAAGLMAKEDISYFRKKYRRFGRLVTGEMIEKLSKERRKLPVYRNAAPLALFVLVGIIIALFFGNIIFLLFA